ncbi:MAG: sporulation protein YqfD [Alicyclobacillaceae bacterium]|nr:sporulation protein YqfD [Alicyclobacillaceae bacterium]
MVLTQFDHLWRGSLYLELRGERVTDVIARLAAEGVPLHHVRVGGRRATLVVALGDFWTLYRVCRRSGVRLRILERSGLPFLWRRAWRRPSFLAGVGLFLAILWTAGSMVWTVDVRGADEDVRAQVLQAAQDVGLYPGAWRRRLPGPDVLQAAILARVPALAWAGVKVEGARAEVEVVPKVPDVKPEPVEPRNIVAGKPAVIIRVLATRGEVVVKPGQVVSPGQVLISGSLAEGTKQVPAAGHAFAEVWYTSRVEVKLEVTQQELTGRSVTKKYLDLAGAGVPVWGFAALPYPASVQRQEETDWRVGPFRLPVQLRTVRVYEVNARTWTQSVEAAKQTALRLAAQDVVGRMGADGRVLGQTVLQAQVAHGKLYATVMTRTEEDIGVPGRIPAAPRVAARAGEPQG